MAVTVPEAPSWSRPATSATSWRRSLARCAPPTSRRTRSLPTAVPSASSGAGSWTTATRPTMAEIEPRHIEEWIGSILERNKPATAHNRWRGIQRFFNWYATRVDDFLSPMRKLHPPRLPKLMPRVLAFDEMRAVLGTCTGTSFEDRRDDALIRILFDTGARRHEIAALRYSPTDPDDRDVDVRRPPSACSARAARTTSSRWVTGPSRPSMTTSASVASTPTRTCRGCGSASAVGSPIRASPRRSAIAVARRYPGPPRPRLPTRCHPPRAFGRHERGRRHEQARLGLPGDAAALREHHGQRASHRGESQARAGRQASSSWSRVRRPPFAGRTSSGASCSRTCRFAAVTGVPKQRAGRRRRRT